MAKRSHFRYTWKQWWAYQLDLLVRRSMLVQLGALLLIVLAITMTAALLLWTIAGGIPFSAASWWAFLRVIDSGYLGEDSSDTPYAVIGTATVFVGLLVFGALISVVQNALQQRVERIRKGRRFVPEANHTLILGWSRVTLPLITQIVQGAMSNSAGLRRWCLRPRRHWPVIAILSGHDVDWMAERVETLFREELARLDAAREAMTPEQRRATARFRRQWRAFLRTGLRGHVILRTGDIGRVADLQIVNARYASDVIICPGPSEGETLARADAMAVQSALGCLRLLGRDHSANISVIVDDPAIGPVVSSLNERHFSSGSAARRDSTIACVSESDFVAAVVAKCACQKGLHVVLEDLFSYEDPTAEEGCEFYQVEPAASLFTPGRTIDFADLARCFPDAIPVGIARENRVRLNPMPGRSPLLPGDSIIVLARNLPAAPAAVPAAPPAPPKPPTLDPEALTYRGELRRILVIGDGDKADKIIGKIRENDAPGFEVQQWVDIRGSAEGSATESARGSLCHRSGEYAFAILQHCDVVVLAEAIDDPDLHDARILLELLESAQDMARYDKKSWELIAEFLDPESAELGHLLDPVTTIVSTRLLSKYLVQISRRPVRKQIFDELLSEKGQNLLMVPMERLLRNRREALPFSDVCAACRAFEESPQVLGFAEAGGRLRLAPSPGEPVPPDATLVVLCHLPA